MPELLGAILTRAEDAALGLAQAQGSRPFTWPFAICARHPAVPGVLPVIRKLST
jgi:hypothetical protein